MGLSSGEEGNVPEAMIELDLTVPWEPPEVPEPRRRGRRPWPALVVVVVLTAGLLVAAVPRQSTGPVFTVDFQVLSVNVAGGRAVVTRYQPVGTGPQIEALSLRDGTPLWSLPVDLEVHLAYVTDRVVMLMTESVQPDDPDGPSGALTALDAATGRTLWERRRVRLVGATGGRILIEDLTGLLDRDVDGNGYTEVDDPGLNVAAELRDMRFVGLDEWTGTAAWELSVPKGTVAGVGWSGDYGELSDLKELSPTGLLRFRDLTTGTVTATHQLDWSGTVSSYSTGVDGQVVVYRAGERGADVYDRATGRRLWRWPGDQLRWNMLYACLPDLYCVQDGTGLGTVDARTGRPAWHIDRYDGILQLGTATLTVAAFARLDTTPTEIAIVDARTGAIRRRVGDWYVVETFTGGRTVVWRPVNNRDAMLGVVDEHTGRITVFGRAKDWYGRPDCAVDGRTLACVVVGGLSVWTLP
jgi:outer membrane protein assembly factor BamB